jgi:hypothetical protein
MIVYALIFFGFMMRLLPHGANFEPVAAIALFSGAFLDKRTAPWVPLAVMMVSDLVIGLHDVVPYTWGAFVLIAFIGMYLRERRTPANILAASLLSATVFFAISNFGVWLAWYPHTADGFAMCYIKAIPFFRNTLAGTVMYSAALFGIYELARRVVVSPKLRTVLIAESR